MGGMTNGIISRFRSSEGVRNRGRWEETEMGRDGDGKAREGVKERK